MMKARELEVSLLVAEAEVGFGVEAGQRALSELMDLENCWAVRCDQHRLSASTKARCWRHCPGDAAPTAAASDGAAATAAFVVNAARVN